MALAANPTKIHYPGPGGTSFPFPYPVTVASDLKVYKTDLTTEAITGSALLLGTDYNISGAGGSSCTVTLTSDLGQYGLFLKRVVPLTQGVVLDNSATFAPKIHENEFDKLTQIDQQQAEEIGRALKFSETSPSSGKVFPEPAPGYALVWDASGNLVNAPSANADYLLDLADTTDALKNAGRIGYNDALAYATNTVGDWIRTKLVKLTDLAGSGGAALVGVKRTLTGAVATTEHAVNEGRVIDLITDFGADPTGVVDATSDFNKAIKAGIDAGAGGGDYGTQLSCKIIAGKPGAKFKILGTVIVPQNFEIDLQGAMLTGSGFTGSDNVCFQTGYVSGGVAVSNDGTSENSHLIHSLKIRNVNFVDFKRALNLWNVNDGCSFDGLTFYNCLYSVYSVYSFYALFHNLFTRGAAGGAANGAYHFDYFSNVMGLDSVFCQGRELGFEFYHACDGLELRNCSVEGGGKGMFWGSEVNTLKLDNCYFEALTGLVLDFSTAAAHRNVTIDNSFFNGCVGPLLSGVQMGSGCTWGRGNTITLNTAWLTGTVYALNALVSSGSLNYYCSIPHTSGTFATDLAAGKWTLSTTLYLPDGQSNYMKVIQPDVVAVSPTAASILKTSNATLAKTLNVEGRTIATDGGGNFTVVDAAASLLESPIPLNYFGKCTDTAIGATTGVPFCTVSGTTNIIINTKIAYDDYVMGLFCIDFKEAGAVYHRMAGRFYGLVAYLDNSDGGKTCTVTAQAAADGKPYLQFTFATFGVAIANTYGVIRIA